MLIKVFFILLFIILTSSGFCDTLLLFPREEKALQIKTELSETKKDVNHVSGRSMIQMKSPDGLTSFFANIYLNQSNMSPKEVRSILLESLKKNKKIKISGLKTSYINNTAYYEYTLKKINKMTLNQKNIGHITINGRYIVAINASKAFFEKKDSKILRSLSENTEIVEINYNIFQNMIAGAASQIKKENSKARNFYEKALKIYKKTPDNKVTQETFIALSDALGLIYFTENEYEKAIELYIYSASIAQNNPLIYYHIAEAYAAQNDVDKTISYLKICYSTNEKNSPKIEIPSPEKNKYMKKLNKNKTFKNFLKNYI